MGELPYKNRENPEIWAGKHGIRANTTEEDKKREAQKRIAEQNRRKEIHNKAPESFNLINQAFDTCYCPQCNTIVNKSQKFCHSCGVKLKR